MQSTKPTGEGRPRKPYADRTGEGLKEGQILSTQIRRACVKRLMDLVLGTLYGNISNTPNSRLAFHFNVEYIRLLSHALPQPFHFGLKDLAFDPGLTDARVPPWRRSSTTHSLV
ncbi:hypothetical protein EVAR_14136_1 [Eumeta japonica]|uniref:Uncharacterized protein n=1 Tax=Eumeta variegata TaxID=151549 RepID=A0A4C1UE94_EUMVA|nr:hypothetical protein EVAR_14136_1 [Eumeta japonica]